MRAQFQASYRLNDNSIGVQSYQTKQIDPDNLAQPKQQQIQFISCQIELLMATFV